MDVHISYAKVRHCPAPKGASDFARLTVSLKRYPDTKLVDIQLIDVRFVDIQLVDTQLEFFGNLMRGAPTNPYDFLMKVLQ